VGIENFFRGTGGVRVQIVKAAQKRRPCLKSVSHVGRDSLPPRFRLPRNNLTTYIIKNINIYGI
jgi:hypothetical protein